MAVVKVLETYEMPAAGATKTFTVSKDVDVYELTAETGAINLAANMIFSVSGSPAIGTEFVFLYRGAVTVGAFKVSFFGTDLTADQALYPAIIHAFYTGSAWEVMVFTANNSGNINILGSDLVDGTVTNAKLAGSITPSKIVAAVARGYAMRAGVNGVWEAFNAKTTGTFLGGDNTDLVMQTMSGDATLNGAGVITLEANAVTTTKITDANVTVAKVSTDLKAELIVLPASFESGEVGAIKIKMPYPGSIVNIYAIATKAIANTDAGTIVLKNNGGTTMTVTTPISFAASDIFGTSYTSAVTANNTFVDGDILTILTAKTTVGGKVLVSLEVTRS